MFINIYYKIFAFFEKKVVTPIFKHIRLNSEIYEMQATSSKMVFILYLISFNVTFFVRKPMIVLYFFKSNNIYLKKNNNSIKIVMVERL